MIPVVRKLLKDLIDDFLMSVVDEDERDNSRAVLNRFLSWLDVFWK